MRIFIVFSCALFFLNCEHATETEDRSLNCSEITYPSDSMFQLLEDLDRENTSQSDSMFEVIEDYERDNLSSNKDSIISTPKNDTTKTDRLDWVVTDVGIKMGMPYYHKDSIGVIMVAEISDEDFKIVNTSEGFYISDRTNSPFPAEIELFWDGTDENGNLMQAGDYWLKLSVFYTDTSHFTCKEFAVGEAL